MHTADWQIGMKAAHVGKVAPRVRDARLVSARRVVDLANERGVAVLVVAGDTFEDSDVPRDLVQRVADILSSSRSPVIVLPANHDPLVPGGVWEHPAWLDKEPHVHVARSSEPIDIDGVRFLPCPLSRRTSPEDPTDAIPTLPTADDRIRVGIAHGSLRGAGAAEDQIADDFPIDRAVVRRARLDYLALGHWHTPSLHAIDGVERIAYCGSHEPTKFGETSESGASGQCLLVTIDAPGATPSIEALRTQRLEWRQTKREILGAEEVAAVRTMLEHEPPESKGQVLFDLVLTGSIAPSDAAALDDLEILARERFLFARIRRETLILKPETQAWIEDLPPGVPHAVARRLLDRATAPAEVHVAREALDLLYRISREVAR